MVFVVLAEVLVHDPAHEVVLDRHLQGHVMRLAGLELAHAATNVRRAFVGGLGTRLPRVVVAHVKRVPVHLAPMHLQDAVFQDGRVIVKITLEDGAVGNLLEARGDFDRAVGCEVRIGRSQARSVRSLATRGDRPGAGH